MNLKRETWLMVYGLFVFGLVAVTLINRRVDFSFMQSESESLREFREQRTVAEERAADGRRRLEHPFFKDVISFAESTLVKRGYDSPRGWQLVSESRPECEFYIEGRVRKGRATISFIQNIYSDTCKIEICVNGHTVFWRMEARAKVLNPE